MKSNHKLPTFVLREPTQELKLKVLEISDETSDTFADKVISSVEESVLRAGGKAI